MELPTPDAALPSLQSALPPAAEATVRDAGDGGEAATGNIPAQPAKKQAKRGRPSKSNAEVYVTAKEEFKRARNHIEVSAAWVLVATLVN
ncbi:hypothetical protein PR003_g16213 [Phytophthora rubi]|uniref:Uncharacterized protein n=1 Tax=Phytophthora rubi TaxID=129364 RepID=A0A6A4ERS7_9STRA|nr:hypothetical protein PR002_g15137 [Phytophthora rubi]KAE9013577.1 hypothetical protein PR001_g15375 [Phytophthora rubi]KAE9326591.1 hypothetical protein PR003_g16213 [Phytophthora rubi]